MNGKKMTLGLSELRESEWNPRKHFPTASMAELVASMREHGFREWLPIVVRQDSVDHDMYEIGAGHRRYRAAREAGLTEVPCLVIEATDAEFLDVLNFDNSSREDVHPVEEAAGWRHWMEATGLAVKDIAARIGQSQGYVYQRLKYAALTDEVKAAFLDGEISAGHAILIARQTPEQQELLLAWLRRFGEDIPGVRQLGNYIQHKFVPMDRAHFDLADAGLVASAGSCHACSKRTCNDTSLLVEGQPVVDACTDAVCYAGKITNHVNNLCAQAEADGKSLIRISGLHWQSGKGVLGFASFNERVDGADCGVYVDGDDAGKVVQIQLRQAFQQQSAEPSGSDATSTSESLAQEGSKSNFRAKLAEQKRQQEIVDKVKRATVTAIVAKVGGVSKADVVFLLDYMFDASNPEDMRAFCEACGIEIPADRLGDDDFEIASWLKGRLPKLGEDVLHKLLVAIPAWDGPASNLVDLAKRYRINTAKITQKIEDAMKEAEGGDRREVAEEPAPVEPSAAKPRGKKKSSPPADDSGAANAG
jgi:ParB/RepB/Spo0J family partition protein